LDVVYWLRQIIGLVVGVVWGVVPLKGILGILLYVIFCEFFAHVNNKLLISFELLVYW